MSSENVYVHYYDHKLIFDMETLDNYLRYAAGDIEQLEEHIKKLKKYQESIKQQKLVVSSTETVPEVNLRRAHKYRSNNIEFFVSVRHVPQIEVLKDHRNLHIASSESKMFEGRQRNIAINYAKELAKKYQCEIKKVGFPK